MADRRPFRFTAPLAVAAGLLGVLVLVALFWMLARTGPASGPHGEEIVPQDTEELGPEARRAERERLPPGGFRGPVARFESRVTSVLAARMPNRQPLQGALRFRADRVVWTDEDRPFFRARAVGGLLEIGALARGNTVTRAVTVEQPEVYLERPGEDADWNWERVLAGFLEDDPGDAGTFTLLRNIAVRGGTVEIRLGQKSYIVRDVHGVASRYAAGLPDRPDPEVTVAQASGTLRLGAEGAPVALTTREATFRVGEDAVAFDVARLTLGRTVLTDARGRWTPQDPGVPVEGELRGETLRLADLQPFLPDTVELPEGEASFRLRLERRPGGRTLLDFRGLRLASGESLAAGAVSVVVGGVGRPALESADLRLDPLALDLVEGFAGPLPFTGRLSGRVFGSAAALRFDLDGRLRPREGGEPFDVKLAGRAAVGADRFQILALEGDLRSVPLGAFRTFARGLPLEGVVTGRIELKGPPGRTPLDLDVRLELGGGTALVQGRVDLTGAVPAYDVRGQVVGVELPRLVEPDVPAVAVTARFTLSGRGVDPRSATARLTADGGFTGWRARAGDTLALRLALDRGVLTVDTAALALVTLSAEASGRWRLVAPGEGAVRYRVLVSALEPFGPYLPFITNARAGGSLETEGTVSGTLDSPRVAGEAESTELRYGQWAASTARSRYGVAMGGPSPDIDVEVAARGIDTPAAGAFEAATAKLRVAPAGFVVDIRADRVVGGVIEIAADGRLEVEGENTADIRHLAVDLGEERWRMVRPARLRWGGASGVHIDGLAVEQENGPGRVALNGRLLRAGAADLHLEVAALPIGELFQLVHPEAPLTGDVWARLDVSGRAAAPRIAGDFRLERGSVRGITIGRLEGELEYQGQRLAARADGVFEKGGTLSLDASLPLDLSLADSLRARLVRSGPLRATFSADSFPLATLASLSPRLRDPEGLLTGLVTLSGTPERPLFEGGIRLEGGGLTVVAFNQRYDSIGAEVELSGREARIRQIRAHSDGWVRIGGTITFEELTRPSAELDVEFDGFRAVGINDLTDAAITGTLRIANSLRSPVITGRLTLDDGNLPIQSLAAPGLDDQFIELGAPATVLGQEVSAAPAPWLEDVTLDDLVIRAGDALWFVTEEARAQLSGELTLTKHGEDLRVFGTLEGKRGTFTLRVGPLVRRFEIIDARVRFFGTPEPDPALEVTASRIILGPEGQRVEIHARLGGTMTSPRLTLSTADGANIPESELLSFLVFGQPSFALGTGAIPGQAILQEMFVGGLADVATIGLEDVLLEEIGLPFDVFQIRSAPGRYGLLGTPVVVLGRQVSNDLFLTVEAGIASLFSTWSANLEWRIDRQWTGRLGLEPINRLRFFRGVELPGFIRTEGHQLTAELRRRWTY